MAGSDSSKDDDPRVTRTRFTWTRTMLEDHAGSDRFYDGAIVLHRKKNEPLTLMVKVEAQPWLWHHRVNFSRSTPRNSHPIEARTGSLLEPEAFAKLHNNIQERVLARNPKLAATEFTNTQTAIVALSQIDTVVAEWPAAREDETKTDGFDLANLLICTTTSVVGQVLAT